MAALSDPAPLQKTLMLQANISLAGLPESSLQEARNHTFQLLMFNGSSDPGTLTILDTAMRANLTNAPRLGSRLVLSNLIMTNM